jgi:hypothetical protein
MTGGERDGAGASCPPGPEASEKAEEERAGEAREKDGTEVPAAGRTASPARTRNIAAVFAFLKIGD